MLASEILYEDNEVLVLNKPAGLTVHPDNFLPPTDGTFLTTWLIEKYPEIKGVGEDMDRPGIVHRLDKDTSGVMIVAKTPATFLFLKEQFKNRQVEKTYLGLVASEFKAGVGAAGEINLPIGRSLKDARVRVASNKAYGQLREAVTLYKVLAQGGGYALVELKPLTGRTHQLRAHLKALQHPIVCDVLYGTGNNCPAGLKRQGLHANTLKFTLPSGETREFTAPPPADLAAVLAQLKFTC
ncbi:MAG: RluA family pseudouridine synthase [bacterium]|nr:RluA family pseudouridine synthase [bacterium]